MKTETCTSGSSSVTILVYELESVHEKSSEKVLTSRAPTAALSLDSLPPDRNEREKPARTSTVPTYLYSR